MTEEPKKTVGKPFEKGKSGNPGGRPKVIADLRDLAREHTVDALNALTDIMQNPQSTDAARVSAACAVLDRGYGKPSQQVEHTGKDGKDLKTVEQSDIDVARRIAFILARADHALQNQKHGQSDNPKKGSYRQSDIFPIRREIAPTEGLRY